MSPEARPDITTPPVTEIVVFPPEVDISNAAQIEAKLHTATQPGTSIVIANMTATTFCDSMGLSALLLAHERAARNGAELRVVTASPAVLRVMQITGTDHVLHVYPDLAAATFALADEPAATRGTRNTAQTMER